MIKKVLNLSLALSVSLLAGCVATGTLQGISDGKVVPIDYEQGFGENDGTLRVTMPDGELFTGKFVQKSSFRSGTDLEIGESSDDDVLVFRDTEVTSSTADAILAGNRGNSMECSFQFSDPEFGIDGGGIGRCITSNDHSINVTF